MSFTGDNGVRYNYSQIGDTYESTYLDTADNAWQLTAASFVALQSMAGLTILYAGMVHSKWAINSAFMVIYAFSATLIIWVLWAYKMSFGEYWLPFLGKPGPVVSMSQELIQSQLPSSNLVQNFPLSTMIYFQFVFAAITIIIAAGSFLGRMSFKAWVIFVPLWITFSYTIGAYSIWGGGFLFQLGLIDYSGGYVIHISSGTAGFVGAIWLGPRLAADRDDKRPNNILSVVAGAGMLWIGWNGFNGGDPYAVSADAGAAVLNTNLCTAVSLLCWTICDVIYTKKPSIIGAVQGMIAGLVAITPCAGVVSGWASICIGFASGTIPWVSMNFLGKLYYFARVDDTLGVFHTHLVAGIVGGFCAGLFASSEGTAAFASVSHGGAIEGIGGQVWLQVVGALFVIGWNIVWTSAIMAFIKYVLRVPLRMSDEELIAGSEMVHGEVPYTFQPFDVEALLAAGQYVKKSDVGENGDSTIQGQAPYSLKSTDAEAQEIKLD